MNDKELLEFAAKAGGIVVIRPRLDDPMNNDFLVENSCRNEFQAGGPWNPLTDDGDALRLAVKLGMYLNIYTHPKMQQTNVGASSRFLVTEAHESDSDSATRRAIVRAAAEIGKSL